MKEAIPTVSMSPCARYVGLDYDKLLIGAPLSDRAIAKWERRRQKAREPLKPLSKKVKAERRKKQKLVELLSKYD